MNIENAKGYERAPQLMEQYEAANERLRVANIAQEVAMREFSLAKRALAKALIPEDSKSGQSYRVWIPRGLIELIVEPGCNDRCTVKWIVKDESRQPKRLAD